MKIRNIKNVISNNETAEILLDIEFEPSIATKWELEDSSVLVMFTPNENFSVYNLELIDKGMKVHGFEFTEDDEEKITIFLRKQNIKKSIKN